jgi:hypothetical protein
VVVLNLGCGVKFGFMGGGDVCCVRVVCGMCLVGMDGVTNLSQVGNLLRIRN